ncbi:CC0125/CC1285 family lipoprotein [Sphingomonas sp. RS6]
MPILTSKRRRLVALGLAAAGSLSLASCMTATPYQPAMGNGYARNGYSDEQIEDNRFRVSFAGNSLTSRETVERYLLYRAAELTLQNGYDYFILSDRETEKKTQTYATPGLGGAGPWGFWNPYWRYYSPRWGWRTWDPFWGDPFFDRNVDIRTVDRYEAIAEIVMGKGPKPADNLRAFDAREVQTRLGPKIQAPKTR